MSLSGGLIAHIGHNREILLNPSQYRYRHRLFFGDTIAVGNRQLNINNPARGGDPRGGKGKSTNNNKYLDTAYHSLTLATPKGARANSGYQGRLTYRIQPLGGATPHGEISDDKQVTN